MKHSMVSRKACILALLFAAFSGHAHESADFKIYDHNGDGINDAYQFVDCVKLEPNEFKNKKVADVSFVTPFKSGDVWYPRGPEVIPEGCFSNNNLTSLLIPEGVKRIEKSAFAGCKALSELRFSESLEYIGPQAFSGCTKVETIALPKSLKELALSAFAGGGNVGDKDGFYLTKIWIGSNVKIDSRSYGDNGFVNAYKANNYQAGWYEFKEYVSYGRGPSYQIWAYLPDTDAPPAPLSDFDFGWGEITGYRGGAKEVVIPAVLYGRPVTSIESGAFRGKQLTGVVIPAGVTSIGDGAFENNALSGVVIPDSVISIGREAFANNKLTALTLPAGLTSLGERAFENNALTGIVIPDSLTEIKHGVFNGNPLTGVTISEKVKIESNGSNEYFYEENSYNGDERDKPPFYNFGGYYYSLGRKAGTYRVAGKRWLLPLSEAEEKLTAAEADFEVLQLPDGTIRITGYSGAAKNVVIPGTISGIRVTSIGSRAFAGKGLYTVVIPDGVTEIQAGPRYDDGAFFGNTLTSVRIGKGLKTISDFAFYGNKTLTALVLPDGITEIGNDAFADCALSDITWGKGLVTIGERSFKSNMLTVLDIPGSVTSMKEGAFYDNPLTAIVFPASLAQYGRVNNAGRGFVGAFASYTATTLKNLTRVTVPANMAEENLRDFPISFINFWKYQNKAAGTYGIKNRLWVVIK